MTHHFHPYMNPNLSDRERLRKTKDFAHSEVFKAVRDGRLVRPVECSRCGRQGRIEAHHEDYTKPLEVTWLCHSCNTSMRLHKYD